MRKIRFAATKRALLGGVIAISSIAATAHAEIRVLEEVTVTAQKRSENLQDTPITVYAFTQDALRDAGAYDLKSLSGSVPSLHISELGNDLSIGLRGVSGFEYGERGDSSLAFHLDGIYIARQYGAGAPFYDVERLEVLSGPQGTLYGRNATAGLLNVISRKPVDSFEASIDVAVGNYDHVSTEAMINIPVSDKLAVRGALFQNKHDGYRDNGSTVKDGDDADDFSSRIHISYDPTDNLSLLFSADYTKKEGVGAAWSLRGTGRDEDEWNLDSEGSQNDEMWGVRWQADWDFDQFTLTYIGSHREADVNWDNQDYDGTTTVILGFEETWTFKTESKEKSHELRLTSNSDGIMEWIVGIYYFEEEQDVAGIYTGFSETWIWDYGFFEPGIASAESKAAFGQVSIHATDKLTFTFGLRTTKDEKLRTGDVKGFDSSNTLYYQEDYLAGDDWSKTNWKVGIDWAITEDSMIYFSASTGYKAGGYNDGFNVPGYDPEELTAYELGVKNRLFEDRLQLNASAFYYDYENILISQVENNNLVTRNAGTAEILGLELSLIALITEDDKIDFNIGYVDSEYTDTTFYEPFLGTDIDINGNQLLKAPELSFSLGMEHAWSFDNDGSFKARIQTAYSSETHLRPFNFSDEEQDAYFKTDLLLTYTSAAEKWYVQGFVRNLENEMVATGVIPATFGLLEAYSEPRTYGVKLGYKWF